jgi:hypothetical protein
MRRCDVLSNLRALTFGTIPELFRISEPIGRIRECALSQGKVAAANIGRNARIVVNVSRRKATVKEQSEEDMSVCT